MKNKSNDDLENMKGLIEYKINDTMYMLNSLSLKDEKHMITQSLQNQVTILQALNYLISKEK